uniref:Retinol dehydrogenase 13 n=1 Tax=Plectus sambesii TaxID=2011161 RepID=A0A914VHB8_9BILA
VPAKIDKAALSCLIPESTAKTSSYRLYSMSKLCNVLFAFQLADKELQHGIIVNAVHPGTAVPTAIAKNTTLGKIVFFLTKPFTKTIQCGASTIVYCAVHPDVQTITGRYFEDNWYSEKRLDRKRARNETLQNVLWQESERLIAVFEPKTA